MLKKLLRQARAFKNSVRETRRGFSKWLSHDHWNWSASALEVAPPNALRDFFDARKQGPGVWKWNHYFEIYDRHFCHFRNREVHVLEIGIYSGGSLEMWKSYFGPRCKIYGVDVAPECKSYQSDSVRVFIGDQADRQFWTRFKQEVPAIDIVIDDGGHLPEQQIVTLEELLPFLRPGGVYLCEDVLVPFNEFSSYVHGLAQNLNVFDQTEANPEDNERCMVCRAQPLQSAVGSIHFYPFVIVIERTVAPVSELVSPKHGTEWQPFLK